MKYGKKSFGPFYAMWEIARRHTFLTFGIGNLEIQINKWPSKTK